MVIDVLYEIKGREGVRRTSATKADDVYDPRNAEPAPKLTVPRPSETADSSTRDS